MSIATKDYTASGGCFFRTGFRNFSLLFVLIFSVLIADAQTGKPLFTAPLGVQAYSFRKSFPNSIEKKPSTPLRCSASQSLKVVAEEYLLKNSRSYAMHAASVFHLQAQDLSSYKDHRIQWRCGRRHSDRNM